LISGFQRADSELYNSNLPVKGEPMSGTDTYALSLVTLSPTLDKNAIQSQYDTANSLKRKEFQSINEV